MKRFRARPSPISGYGVFAEEKILKNEIVEECPFIPIKNDFEDFQASDISFTIDNSVNYMVLGYGSVYNHSKNFNLKFTVDPKAEVVIYKATRDIDINEELTINYGDDWFTSRNESIYNSNQDYRAPDDDSDLSQARILRLARLLLLTAVAFIIVYGLNTH